LLYGVITSLDGFVADETGNFDWSEPAAEVHQFVNDRERSIGTYLYGRRLYEVLKAWETFGDDDAVTRDYAKQWRAADKIVYSSTLEAVETARTRIERAWHPSILDSIDGDVLIGGPTLAAAAIEHITDFEFYVSPVIVGGGTRALPDGVKLDLRLVDERRFDNGVVWTHCSRS
jgi:riboflavin biosynthesis pyrimidine reductase